MGCLNVMMAQRRVAFCSRLLDEHLRLSAVFMHEQQQAPNPGFGRHAEDWLLDKHHDNPRESVLHLELA